jgi:hypothetical protein
MEIERQSNKFSFFTKSQKNEKHSFVLNAVLMLFFAPTILMLGVHVANEVYIGLSTKPQDVSIYYFNHKEVKDFSVKALSEMLTLDKNYSHQAIDAMDNYMTDGGRHSYAEILDKQYKQKIELFKANPQSKQTVNIDRYSLVQLNGSNKGNIYQVKYQEKLLNNKVETVTDKMACLHLIQQKQQIKISNIAIADSDKGCSISFE